VQNNTSSPLDCDQWNYFLNPLLAKPITDITGCYQGDDRSVPVAFDAYKGWVQSRGFAGYSIN
jgi:hypothetical protein